MDSRFTVVQDVECVLVEVMFVQLSQYFYLNKQTKNPIHFAKKKRYPLNGDGLYVRYPSALIIF